MSLQSQRFLTSHPSCALSSSGNSSALIRIMYLTRATDQTEAAIRQHDDKDVFDQTYIKTKSFVFIIAIVVMMVRYKSHLLVVYMPQFPPLRN